MRIIEFAGLPGCGKSTLCTKLIEQISGKKIYTYKDIVRFVSTKNRRRIYGTLVALNPLRWKFLRLLKRFVKKYKDVSMQAVFILIALYDITSLLRMNKQCIVILDEGFVQNLTSVAHLQQISGEKELEELVACIQAKNQMLIVNCFADEDIVIRRLRQRNGRDRFNSIKDEKQLRAALCTKQNNISFVAQLFTDKIDICMNGSTDSALEQIMKSTDTTRW